MARIPTAPVAAGTLIAGYAVAVASGSRPLGGVVLLIGGGWCARAWSARHDPRTAMTLTTVGLIAFIASHVLGAQIGAWPAVLLVAALAGTIVWVRADLREPAAPAALALRPPAR
ncbi:MAG: hypothetical protein H0X28_14680 [Solirubrobacterales bacterium]|nr:hypothetical protein [Solirubrobacterales bacterium]